MWDNNINLENEKALLPLILCTTSVTLDLSFAALTEEAERVEALTQETGSKEEKSEPEIAVESEAVVETVEEDEEKDSSKKETDDWEEVA